MFDLKRIAAAGLVAALGVGMLAGCAKGSGEEKKEPLTLGTVVPYAPYEMASETEEGQYEGIEIEIAQAIAEKLGRELAVSTDEYQSIMNSTQIGKYDMTMAAITLPEDDDKKSEKKDKKDDKTDYDVVYSESYASAKPALLKKKGGLVGGVDDLSRKGNDYKIAVLKGSNYSDLAIDKYGTDRVYNYQSFSDAIQGLKDGKADCLFADEFVAKYYAANDDELDLVNTKFDAVDYAVCFAKDSEIVEDVNKALSELEEEGQIDEIIEKYTTDKADSETTEEK